MRSRLLVSISGMILLMAATAMAQPRGGPPRGGRGPGGRGGPQGGTERLVDNMTLTSLQQGVDARAAVAAYDQTIRQQTLQARAELLEKMKTILSSEQLSQFKDQLEQIPLLPLGPPQPRGVATSDLVDRVASFDRNNDGRITRDELPERMFGLLSEGDLNHDNGLDKEELKQLAERSSVNDPPPGRGGRGRGRAPQ